MPTIDYKQTLSNNHKMPERGGCYVASPLEAVHIIDQIVVFWIPHARVAKVCGCFTKLPDLIFRLRG